MAEINNRDKDILGAIIQEYINTGEPVGSRVVARRYMMNISPATVRNAMADLEEAGYLYQPHVSAGRIPTPEGFRCYLNEIVELKTLPRSEMSMISRQMSLVKGGVKTRMSKASTLLSEISKNASIVILPRLDSFSFRHMEFVRLDDRRILVVLISRAGMVYNHTIECEDVSQEDLIKYSNYINDAYAGLSIQEMRDMLLEEMSKEKTRFDRIVSNAINLGVLAIDGVSDIPDIVIDGKESVFNHPGLVDFDRLKDIVRAFEDKGQILGILNRMIDQPGVRVMIGEEMDHIGMNDFCMVASGYCRGDIPVGSLGVIGPVRMDYARVIPLVDYMARVLGKVLKES
ncbi:MAG: heat-inducible transcriptional repressor HrcA [Thermodesulfobacteriota bacterium]|nr:heat-inducible transcriptional repressor HrcA [Thermodesulfobacteriota bacterium]